MIQLTKEQHNIVHHNNGHALVSAVAGSGKTTTMVARVHHLLQEGCKPSEIMVLMFNRSARDGFARALNTKLAGTRLSIPEVRTYHSLGLRLVESFTRKGVLPARKLITDEHIKEKLAKQVLNSAYKEENGNHAWVSKEDLEEFLRFIDLVKSSTESGSACFEREGFRKKYAYFIDGFSLFEEVRAQQRIRFFEDLLHEPLMAMLDNSDLAEWVSNRVEHIIVDEYQDINEVQQQLLKILAGSRAKVMVVGDVDQCIYEWRGARPEYITNRFQHDFQKPRNYTLSYTFRYGHRLSLAANHLISNNRMRDRKLCISADDNFDTRIVRYEEKTIHPILKIIETWQNEGRSLSEVVALVRLFGLSVPLELALLEADIPYRLEGHEQVFECREILALTGYLKLCSGTLQDEEQQLQKDHLIAMLSQPHLGIRQEELEKLAAEISTNLSEAPDRILWTIHSDMPAFIKKKIVKTAEDWEWLMRKSANKRADLLLTEIISYLDLYEFYVKFSSRLATAENRIETCRSFVEFASRQKLSVDEFLVKLDSLKRPVEAEVENSLLITSVHRAKGLEWPLVIIPGLKDGSFPFTAEVGEGKGKDTNNLEDERRLFYVAITRAIEQVALIHPPDHVLKKRAEMGMGVAPVDFSQASRFLFEANLWLSDKVGEQIVTKNVADAKNLNVVDISIANDYLKKINAAVPQIEKRKTPTAKNTVVRRTHTLRTSDLAKGLKVEHKSFGEGKIVEVLDRSQGRIRIAFTDHGEKTLLLSFAPLAVIV